MRQRPLHYADRQSDSPANPSGVYWEGDVLWVYSDRHQRQWSFRRQQGRYRPGPQRRGPAGTVRCEVGSQELEGMTLCVGRHHSGGLVGFGARVPRWSLPARAGFRDLAMLPALGLVAVLDSVRNELLLLDSRGSLISRSSVPAAAYRVRSMGPSHVVVLAGTQPRLTLLRVAGGGETDVVVQQHRQAPIRDAHYDRTHDLLWLAGPENRRVSRQRGPVEHLGSVVSGLQANALRSGRIEVAVRLRLQPLGLADATRLWSGGGSVAVALTGSDRLGWITRRGGDWALDLRPAGLAPSDLAASGSRLAVAARLDDRVDVYDLDQAVAPIQQLLLDGRPRDGVADLGERLFYGALLWTQSRREPFTCNSCHWDTETDYRQHPGFLQSRWEQTRPVGGVASLKPIFTPGQAAHLVGAVDGFVRLLDERHFKDPMFEEPKLKIRLKGGGVRELGPVDKRRALLHFLAAVPIPPGPYLRSKDPAVRAASEGGARLFFEDCADCHQPRQHLHGSQRVAAQEALLTLQATPLVFGSAGFARAGAGPDLTSAGNRIAPLLGLSRGGPFFASGSATTLDEVLLRVSRERPGVHGGSVPGRYSALQREQLRAFLLNL